MRIESHFFNATLCATEKKLEIELQDFLTNLTFKIYKGSSTKLREKIKDGLTSQGWTDIVELEAGLKISITASNNDYGLCLQTGNMSRFYADLLKLEYLYKKKKVKGAFFIIPSKDAAKKIGSNIANFDRFIRELSIFKEIITVPIFIFGIS
jgi:hypothetical protein